MNYRLMPHVTALEKALRFRQMAHEERRRGAWTWIFVLEAARAWIAEERRDRARAGVTP